MTIELTEAVEWLRDVSVSWPEHAATILAALPEEVTNPKPELPTETGFYEDQYGDPWKLARNGYWYDKSYTVGHHAEIERVRECAPFTRMVPEKPLVTADDLRDAIKAAAELRNFHYYEVLADYINNR